MSQGQQVVVRVAPQLRFFLPARKRDGVLSVAAPVGSSPLHLVESLGIPRTEIGSLRVTSDSIDVEPVSRPQPLPAARFLLDVHLGALARRMRLLGLDTAYHNHGDDTELVAQAIAESRVLLTQDRGLLRRRALPGGAFVRGCRADEQLDDVLDRFATPLAPWTRCPACNAPLVAATAAEVSARLRPGTRRRYTAFSQCPDCDRVYWRGAHAAHLVEIIQRATSR